jgi:hypothetical protein
VIDTIGQPYHVTADGGLSLDFHPGQWDAWDCARRFVFILAGTQGGKTSFGPHWLHREIYHPTIGRGSGDYIAATASYDLFKLKMLPAIRDLFEGITSNGRYWSGDKVLELRDPATGKFWAKKADDPMWGRIILRSAESGSGMESSTANAAWLDECGMDSFTVETWRSIRRRLSLTRGRVLGTTTLYTLYNWLRQLFDEWQNGREDVAFIQFASIQNPSFPRTEFDQALREMPEHVINMQYRGQFDKPPGMIYDAFNSQICVIPPFAFPTDWMGCGCMDYGGINTACLHLRKNPATGVIYVTGEYHQGGRTAEQHAADLKAWNCQLWAGGAKSEGQWRREFRSAGIPVAEPTIADVWIGINRVYALMKQNRLMVFDTCQGTLGQIGTYSRKMNKATGEPIPDEILNKEQYHFLDALRYGILLIEQGIMEVF